MGFPHGTNIHRVLSVPRKHLKLIHHFLRWPSTTYATRVSPPIFSGFTCLVRHAVGHHDLWPTQLILTMAKRGCLNKCYQRSQPEKSENGVQTSCSRYQLTRWYTKLLNVCRSQSPVSFLRQDINTSTPVSGLSGPSGGRAWEE